MSGALSGTLFQKTYSFFGVPTDEALIIRMMQIGLIYTVVVGFYGIIKPAPYGRYTGTTGISAWIYGPGLNARLSWMVWSNINLLQIAIFVTTTSQI